MVRSGVASRTSFSDNPAMHPPPLKPRHRRNWWLIAAIGTVVFLIVVMLSIATYLTLQTLIISHLPPRRATTVADDRADIAASFTGPPPAMDAAALAAVTPLLNAYGDALRLGDAAAIQDCIDFQRMYQEIERTGTIGEISVFESRKYATALQKRLGPYLARIAPSRAWDHYQVRRIEKLPDPSELRVDLKAWPAGLGSVKWQFWINRRAGRWRIYDARSLTEGYRESDDVGAYWAADLGVIAIDRADRLTLNAAADKLRSDPAKAQVLLSSLAGKTFPSHFEAVRQRYYGESQANLGKYDDAVESYERCLRCEDTRYNIDYLLAVAFNRVGKYQAALEHSKRLADLVGEDSRNAIEMGFALAHLNRADEAADVYRSGLRDNCDSVRNFLGLAGVLKPGNNAELATWFGKFTNKSTSFPEIVRGLTFPPNDEAEAIVISAYEKFAPDDAASAYFRAQRKQREKDYPAAAALFKLGMDRQPPGQWTKACQSGYVSALISAGRPLEAYAGSADKRAAFRHIGNQLYYAKNSDALLELVARHAAGDPADAWLHYYRGRIAELNTDWALAERQYAAGMAEAAPDDTATFRYQRVHACEQMSKVLWAYQNIPPAGETFSMLANWIAYECKDPPASRANLLESLIALHRAAVPSDDALPLWEAEIQWLRGDYSAVVETLQRHRDQVLSKRQNEYQFDDRLVRSLVRLQRLDEAQKEADRSKNPLLLVLVSAARSNVGSAKEAMLRYLDDEDADVSDVYNDPDIGPRIRTPAFESFRRRWPRPAKPD
jgi:tetratricopeptide (TPR) repeat protein